MADLRLFGSTSNRIRFTLKDKTTGQGKTGLSISTSGLIISTICDNEAAPIVYTQAGSTIETISALGTFATPTATKCRFKEVDPTNNKGLYEFQFADARFAISSAKRLIISVNDAGSTILDADYEVQLVQFDPYNATNLGLTNLDAAITSRSTYNGTDTSGTATLLTRIGSAITITSGAVDAKVTDVTTIKDESGTYDLRQMMTMIWEICLAGKISGLPVSPAVLRNFADANDRATIAFDADNNRTTITINHAP